MTTPSGMQDSYKNAIYAGGTWIISATALLLYGAFGYFGGKIPGIEELVQFLGSAEGIYLYIAAFLAIFIEGLYVVGSFFPGTTTIIVLAVLSQIGGTTVFLTTIGVILLGWCTAGAVNVTIAALYRSKIASLPQSLHYQIQDRLLTTWFPLFRANYEVQQVAEGANPIKVFMSSLRVKLIASAVAALYALLLPYVVDVQEISNEEGFITLGVVATISMSVGIYKIVSYNRR